MLRRLFRRSRRPSPDDVILAARVIAACLELGDAHQERALRAAGFDARQATRFCVFLPMAFARPALEHLGVTEFVPTVSADLVDGGSLSVRLDRQPEYVAALALAREHRRSRCMPHDVYVAVAGSSADINAVDNALNQGIDVEGSVMASSLVGFYERDDFVR